MFNILDPDSWDEASEKTPFVWKDITFFNEETGNNITEVEFVAFSRQLIGALRQLIPDEKIASAGLSNIMALIIDLMSSGINANNALHLVNIGFVNNVDFSWQIFKDIDKISVNDRKTFYVEDPDSWKFATESNLIWENRHFHISSDKIFSEIIFVKIMILIFYNSLSELYSMHEIRKQNISILLDGLMSDKSIIDIVDQIAYHVKNKNNMIAEHSLKQEMIKTNKANNNYSSQENNDNPSDIKTNAVDSNFLTPPSKAFLFVGVGLLVGGFLYFFYSIGTGYGDANALGKIIFGIVVIFCSIPFFMKHSSEQSKFHYKVICADMAQWVGHSSNDLIMQWGAPTKTYKFPSDKTMTVLEYKDSIRNYAGYRYKGMYAGQAKTTKYIKSFFVKDNIIIDYKYAVT